MKTDFITIGLSLLAGGLAYDKFANDNKITDKVTSAMGSGGGTITETIRETLGGGSEIIRESVLKEVYNNVAEGVGQNLDNLGTMLKETTNNIKNSVGNVVSDVKNKSGGNVQSSSTTAEASFFTKLGAAFNATHYVLSGEANVLDRSFDILTSPFTWAKNKVVASYDNIASGTKNLANASSSATTNFFQDRANEGTILKNNISNGFKSSKNKSKATVKSYSSSNAVKYVGNNDVGVVKVINKGNATQGSYNNKRRQSVNAETTKLFESNKIISNLFG